jgi:transcriptional regulator with XRE-family HTH domain
MARKGSLELKRNFVSVPEASRIRMLGFRYVVASQVEEMMADLGLTQKSLAQRAGISSGNLSRILSGDRNMTLDTLFRLGDSMGCRVKIELESVVTRTGFFNVAARDAVALSDQSSHGHFYAPTAEVG